MEVENYIEKMKEIQTAIIDYLDSETDDDYQILIELIDNSKINSNINGFKSIIKLFCSIIKAHFRSPNFFFKVEKILSFFKSQIKQTYSKEQIVNLFQFNRRILLFLLREELISVDNLNTSIQNIAYFYPEMENIINSEQKKEIFEKYSQFQNYDAEQFKQDRESGENESYICKLIREDSVQDFISHVNTNKISLMSTIKSSLFDTSINECDILLIEYASNFGSVQIIKYLLYNNVQKPEKFYNLSIYGRIAEYIYESVKRDNEFIKNIDDDHKKITREYLNYRSNIANAIFCHHNDIYNYICENLASYSFEAKSEIATPIAIEYNNYACFPKDIRNINFFFNLCEYNLNYLVELFLKYIDLDYNQIVISNQIII